MERHERTHCLRRQRRIEPLCGDAAHLELLHLILHQGNEWDTTSVSPGNRSAGNW
jgi:hypothetical protein